VLRNLRVLVAIASYDFAQLPHLEEVLDSYHDLCIAAAASSSSGGRDDDNNINNAAVVDIVIHATVPYPVTLLDLWNTRFASCGGGEYGVGGSRFSVSVVLKPRSLRLHLVDCHRSLFYDRIDRYDLFVYTEDDIRTTPTTVATYLQETRRIRDLLAEDGDANDPQGQQQRLHFSDFNVGVVRYEYSFPTNVVIDDNTRHATQNVSRVYWEHSGFQPRDVVVPNAVYEVPDEPLKPYYVSMKNHHQGMFLATRDLLKAWKVRKGQGYDCDFSNARNRPGRGPQPTEGTQRVWMSSQMLYGKRHCNVQQVLPKFRFPALTVLHLPNKNYRRVGKYRNRKFADGTEVFEQPHESLLSAMELHLEMRKSFGHYPQLHPQEQQQPRPYQGVVTMIDEVNLARDRTPLLERRMKEYQAYVNRGGILTDDDMTKTVLVEEQ